MSEQETEATNQPETTPAPEPPKFRLIERETIRIEFPLTLEERARIGDRIGHLGRDLRTLEREHEEACEASRKAIAAAKETARSAAEERRDAIKEAAQTFDDALAAQQTGIEKRPIACERRAVIATATIELVRLDTGEVIETRAMNDKEQAKWCRQGTIEEVTGGATVKAGVEPEGGEEASAEPEGAEPESDALDEGEAEALGLPVGWPRSWRGKEWTVKGESLSEGDVLEVYLRLTAAGVSLDELLAGTDAVQGLEAMGLSRPRVGRALSLLRGKGLAERGEGQGVWVLVDRTAVPEEPEPGRSDTLPEAGDAPKPRRQGKAQSKADKLVNAAAEQSDGWGL